MADNDEKVLDISGKILSGLESGLSSAVSSVATSLLGYGLNAILGTDFGTSAKIKEIHADLQGIEDTLSNIEADLETIAQTINVQSDITNIDGIFDSLTGSFSAIGDQWSQFSTYIKSGADTSEVAQLVKDINTHAIDDALYQIALTMVSNSVVMPSRRGSLDVWVDYALTSMNGETYNSTLGYNWYLYLENIFLQMLQSLICGMILVVNARVVHACQTDCQDPTSSNCLDCLLEKAGKDGYDYLNGTFFPLLDQITVAFRTSMQRFILGCYHPEQFTSRSQTTIPFLSVAQLNEIQARIELICWLIPRTKDSSPDGPGIIVRQYFRNSQLGATPPALQPSGDYEASNGTIIDPPKFYNGGINACMPNWYKCVDFTDTPRNYNLADFDSSDIKTVEYRWPWPATGEAPVGTPLSSNEVLAQVTPAYYDVRTLQPVDKASRFTVTLATALLADNIMQPLFFTKQSGEEDSEAGWNVTLFNGGGATYDLESTPRKLMVNADLKGLFNTTLERKISYSGNNRMINVVINATATVSILGMGKTEYKISRKNDHCSHDDKETLADKTYKSQESETDLISEIKSLHLHQNCHPVIQFTMSFSNSRGQLEDNKATLKIYNLRLAWDQPLPQNCT